MYSKEFMLFTTVLLMIAGGCAKKEDTKTIQKGAVKITTHYNPTPPTSSYIYTLHDDIKVELFANGTATQYVSGSGTVDFGQYAYGTYSVRVTAHEDVTVISQGTTNPYADYSEVKSIKVNSSTNALTFEVTF